MRTVLQVPMTADLRSSSSVVAEEMGFSSLQEVVRVLLNRFASRRLSISVEENIIPLSSRNENRYSKMRKDFVKNKNIKVAKDVKDLMSQLNED